MTDTNKALSSAQSDALLETLNTRFERHAKRHKNIQWEEVAARLKAAPHKLRALFEMEETGGEPDVTGQDKISGEFLICDCAPESPSGRRSLCYDNEALLARKEHKPVHSAVGLAEEMGIELLTEEEYRQLHTLGDFDRKTSSWLKTPDDMRQLGGALFGDKRFARVFIYHNGVQSYYAGRGFRGMLRV